MKCPKCGRECVDLFCGHCGITLSSAPPQTMQSAPVQQTYSSPYPPTSYPPHRSTISVSTPKKSRTGCWVTLAICITVVVMLVVFVLLLTLYNAGTSRNSSSHISTTKTTAVSPEDFKNSCQSISFDQLARNPDKYIGENYVFTGEVIQSLEENGTVNLRLNVTKGEYGLWEDTIYIVLDLPSGSDRILEKDIVTVWGTCGGLYDYTSIFGAPVSLPLIYGKYYEIVE